MHVIRLDLYSRYRYSALMSTPAGGALKSTVLAISRFGIACGPLVLDKPSARGSMDLSMEVCTMSNLTYWSIQVYQNVLYDKSHITIKIGQKLQIHMFLGKALNVL